MWHAIAAFVPLPLIGVGYVVASSNQLATEVELELAHPDALQIVVRSADAAATGAIPSAALTLFPDIGKGPRADNYRAAQAVTTAGKQLIAASLTGAPSLAKAANMVSREAKGDRLRPTTSEVALKVPERRRPDNSLFMNASYSSPFNADFQVDSFRPSPEELAYTPTPEALGFRYKGETQAEFEARERRCLAVAIYFEARGEPKRGQIAVAQVILNRVRSPLFPETVCGVVYQGQMRKGCQFSFTCDGHSDNPRDNAQWALAQDLAKGIMSGKHWLPEVGYSTFYHANYVWPRWVRRMNKIDKIGRHIFYKKRNEEPYIVEASVESEGESGSDDEDGYLLPTMSLASAVSAITDSVTESVSAVAGSSEPTTQAMSLGYAESE
jgi:spore germination cell wall hydrolase CwlJ-like protein